jgi:hypothetical protein
MTYAPLVYCVIPRAIKHAAWNVSKTVGGRLSRWMARDNARFNDRAAIRHAVKCRGRMTFGHHSPASIFR